MPVQILLQRISKPLLDMTKILEVHEVQGLYGPLRIPEELIQRLWARRDFSEDRLRTVDGRPLRIHRVGTLNPNEGPDFLDALIEIEGKTFRGDVEVHFRSRNWREHGHHLDPAFASVVLHLVLFPPVAGETVAVTTTGKRPVACALLEAMDCGLEEYAEREAIRQLGGVLATNPFESLSRLSEMERASRFREVAGMRWKHKVKLAAKRLGGTSWEDACHQSLLEVLGYQRNRSPMASIALHHPLGEFAENSPDPDLLFLSRKTEWKLAGVRPANHPRTRLRQYCNLASRIPDWPCRARAFSLDLFPGGEREPTARFRKRVNMPRKRDQLNFDSMGGAIGGGRFHTWVIDGLLPLAAADTGKELFAWWFHWYAGNAPECLSRLLRELGLTGKHAGSACNGWVQGGLGILTGDMPLVA